MTERCDSCHRNVCEIFAKTDDYLNIDSDANFCGIVNRRWAKQI